MTFEEWYTTFCKSWEDQLNFDAMDVYDAMKIAFNAAKEDSKPIAKIVERKLYGMNQVEYSIIGYDGYESAIRSTKEKAIEWAIENGYRAEEN